MDFLSRLFGNQEAILAGQSLFDGKIIIFNLLFVTIIIKRKMILLATGAVENIAKCSLKLSSFY